MFRRRGAGGGGGLGDLPTTSSSNSSGGGLPAVFGGASAGDGSARSIHVQSPAMTKWKQSSRAVKLAYTIAVISFFIVIFGWRTLTYHSAKVHIDCNTLDCTFTMRSVGRQPPVKLSFPRQQLLGAKAVKTNAAGNVVNENININEEWKYENKGNKKKNKNANNYKGPDKDGNYLTYVVRLKDIDPNAPKNANNNNKPPQQGAESDLDLEDLPPVALSSIQHFLVSPQSSDEGQERHLVMRQMGMSQSRRRVRNMVQKIDSYGKKRRHKLSVKENTSPDWKGVLMMVLGGCVCLLSILLGLFWEDEESSARQVHAGPGARRRSQQQQQQRNSLNGQQKAANPYQRATPNKYEVSTTSAAPRKSSGASGLNKKRGSATSTNSATSMRRRG